MQLSDSACLFRRLLGRRRPVSWQHMQQAALEDGPVQGLLGRQRPVSICKLDQGDALALLGGPAEPASLHTCDLDLDLPQVCPL